MKWTAAQIPPQDGRAAVVTRGLGPVTVPELARAGARAKLMARDAAKGDEAARSISATP